jgi:hypothetical protein
MITFISKVYTARSIGKKWVGAFRNKEPTARHAIQGPPLLEVLLKKVKTRVLGGGKCWDRPIDLWEMPRRR